jgi:hypothetical protein
VDPQFSTWWSQASKPENVVAHFCNLPDAWDGALNLQLQQGNISSFDTGALITRYSPHATNVAHVMER